MNLTHKNILILYMASDGSDLICYPEGTLTVQRLYSSHKSSITLLDRTAIILLCFLHFTGPLVDKKSVWQEGASANITWKQLALGTQPSSLI